MDSAMRRLCFCIHMTATERVGHIMSVSKAYQVIFAKYRKLNIIMANNNGTQLRTYAHFVTTENARRFADILEKSLAEGRCWDVDRCRLCGKAFIRQNHLCLLKDGRIIHKKCLQRAVNCGEMSYDDCKEYLHHYFTQDAPPLTIAIWRKAETEVKNSGMRSRRSPERWSTSISLNRAVT